ncbi:MAG: roadblock/LC7 domain-containing protein [Deltaproteobacteria bacterium]|nr:roadblock/LC7 domain-containing protein [Deltaproteobacteria bacterium]
MKDYFKKKEVDPIIESLCRDLNPITIMLITKQGTVISESGDTQSINTTAMAALTAGMFSATREVAKMVGEQQFSILLQQGEKRHIHISLVTEDAMMIIVFEDYRRIGMVRVEAKRAGTKLIEIANREKQRERTANSTSRNGSLSSSGARGKIGETTGKDEKISTPEFKEYALNLIDQIFVTKQQE